MKYLIFFLTIIFYGFSCPSELSYDGSERYRIEGTVTDENGNPLRNINVTLIGTMDDSYLDDGLIQRGYTDDKGKFDLLFSKNNASMYYLKVNNINDYYYNPAKYFNENYSEKYIFFKQERFKDYEFDLSEHCSLASGVALNFVCPNTDENVYFSIDYETDQDLYLDGKIDIYFEKSLIVSKNNSKKIIAPKNSSVKLKIHSRDTTYVDSIFVTDVPYTYTLK